MTVQSKMFGVAAAFVTVLIWAGWVVATRHSVTGILPVHDLGLLRYGVPALLLAPIWLRIGVIPRHVPKRILLLVVLGSGLPFMALASFGMSYIPAANSGVLLHGVMPLWVGVLGAALLGQSLSREKIIGYGLIAAAVITLASMRLDSTEAWLGFAMIVGAALMWATFTHAFRKSGLTALQAVAIVGFWSSLAFAAIAAVQGTRLLEVPPHELLTALLSQGVLAGFLAVLTYGIAIQRLGSAPASAFAALSPLLTALGGWMILNENVGWIDWTAALLAGAGVVLATGLVSARSRFSAAPTS